ncbi:MAG: heavy-metal-associated domain-containing protein [Eubacteriales bacterium]|nr:heavy-metal-associated domain-containing protein [Eubacteriales bacterium]
MGIADLIITLVLVCICIYSVISYRKKVSNGCCGTGSDAEKKVRVKDKNKSHYPYSVRAGVRGMTCSHCKARVENALNEIEGVWATVNLEDNSVLVRSKQPLPEGELRSAVAGAGYAVTDVKNVS